MSGKEHLESKGYKFGPLKEDGYYPVTGTPSDPPPPRDNIHDAVIDGMVHGKGTVDCNGIIDHIEKNAEKYPNGRYMHHSADLDAWLRDNVWGARETGSKEKMMEVGLNTQENWEEVHRQWRLIEFYKKDPRSRWFWIGWWRKSPIAKVWWKISDWWRDR